MTTFFSHNLLQAPEERTKVLNEIAIRKNMKIVPAVDAPAKVIETPADYSLEVEFPCANMFMIPFTRIDNASDEVW